MSLSPLAQAAKDAYYATLLEDPTGYADGWEHAANAVVYRAKAADQSKIQACLDVTAAHDRGYATGLAEAIAFLKDIPETPPHHGLCHKDGCLGFDGGCPRVAFERGAAATHTRIVSLRIAARSVVEAWQVEPAEKFSADWHAEFRCLATALELK